jgi:tetratricopeptide (TPR) repeat protein
MPLVASGLEKDALRDLGLYLIVKEKIMLNTIPDETRKFILEAFAVANPIYCFHLWERSDPIAASIAEFLLNTKSPQKLLGNKDRILNAFTKIQTRFPQYALPLTDPVYHVFPVYAKLLGDAFMATLKITSSEDWEVSDAFGTFGYTDSTSILSRFQYLLKLIEKVWSEFNPGKTIPLRWRKSLTMKLLCPLHFDAIDGESLQVPLVVATLRALCEQPETSTTGKKLPFGYCPVFATGTLDIENGRFGKIAGINEKLAAFIREYGEGLPAILTSHQHMELDNFNRSLLSKVRPLIANNLEELLKLDELRVPLEMLCAPPQLPEIDAMIDTMFRMKRSNRFKDMATIIQWLRPHIQDRPVYAFQLERNLGQTEAHKANFLEAKTRLETASNILNNHRDWFGIAEIIDLATAWGTVAFDVCDTDLAESSLSEAKSLLVHAKATDRVKYWGTICQLKRSTGDYDQAVEAGREAVRIADMALASEAGRDRNYLIHALKAETLLAESQNQWAPLSGRQMHLGFCLHFEAEIARLQKRPFQPPDSPPWSGEWEHPWLFVLLSSARNELNSPEARLEYAQKMVDFAMQMTRGSTESLFALFYSVYEIYNNAIRKSLTEEPLDSLTRWCEALKTKGFPGWYNRLTPYVEKIRWNKGDPMTIVEHLCDAIPYH